MEQVICSDFDVESIVNSALAHLGYFNKILWTAWLINNRN